MTTPAMSTRAILEDIGSRIQRERLNQNTPQAQLAHKAGIARRALQNLEAEGRCTLGTFIHVLRALGKLEQLNLILPDPGPSPLQLARLQGRERKRASRPRTPSRPGAA